MSIWIDVIQCHQRVDGLLAVWGILAPFIHTTIYSLMPSALVGFS